MSQETALILFQFVALIFALSFHECAHAWMASRLGDQTARMLGRVTLNPVKQLDPIGSVALPLISAFMHFPLIGWAKPTPVTPRNFKNYKRDDMLVTLAGPVSNLLLASISLVLLIVMKHTIGWDAVANAAMIALRMQGATLVGHSAAFPIALVLYCSVLINLLLAVFNMLPVPPLDGSHILRHYLPYNAQKMYDQMAGFGGLLLLYLLMQLGVLNIFYIPLFRLFNALLQAA